MKKFKVTYFDQGLKSKEFAPSNGWYNIHNDLMGLNIYEWTVISIEMLPEAIN